MTRGIGCLALLVVIAVVAYQQYSITQMRKEVGGISAKLGMGEETAAEGSNLVTSLAEAQKHAKEARRLIDKKNYSGAREELDEVLTKLDSANTVSKDVTGEMADFLGKARDKATAVFEKAWNDISEETKSNDRK